MSMLSEQCAKLRKLADEISALQRQATNWLWKDSAKLVDATNALREAADTIESLRDRLQATIETCHWEYPQGVNGWVGYIVCSACGHQFSGVDEREWTCCPICRREIKEVGA